MLVELVKLDVLSFVAFFILDSILNEELIDLRFQKEGNVDQIVS